MTCKIVTDQTFLRRMSEPADKAEAGAIARKLTATLQKLNKKTQKRFVREMGKNRGTYTLGIGLAAPQIGILKRVCVVYVNERPLVLINPVVLEASEAKIPFTEGCLSEPGVEFKTRRHIWVKVWAANHRGVLTLGPTAPDNWDETDVLLSVVAQHEIDHLDGILPADRAREDQ